MGILYSPHIMSPPSNLHWFLPCVLHLSNVPLSKLHVFFKLFLHLPFLPLFNLHFAFPFFLQLSCVPLSDLHFPIQFLLHCFSIFSRCKHPVSQAQFDSTTLPSCSTWRLKHFDLFLILASDGHGWIKSTRGPLQNLENGAKWLIQWFKLAAHLFQELSF